MFPPRMPCTYIHPGVVVFSSTYTHAFYLSSLPLFSFSLPPFQIFPRMKWQILHSWGCGGVFSNIGTVCDQCFGPGSALDMRPGSGIQIRTRNPAPGSRCFKNYFQQSEVNARNWWTNLYELVDVLPGSAFTLLHFLRPEARYFYLFSICLHQVVTSRGSDMIYPT